MGTTLLCLEGPRKTAPVRRGKGAEVRVAASGRAHARAPRRRYSSLIAVGRADETEQQLVAERREDDVQVVELDGDQASLALGELVGQPGGDVDRAAEVGGDRLGVDRRRRSTRRRENRRARSAERP